MAKMINTYLLLGGARSGKSLYAEELASELSSRVAYFATSKITDEEMQKRVAIHRKRRPSSWKTFELEGEALSEEEIFIVIDKIMESECEVVLVDCVTNLVFRLIEDLELDRYEVITNELEQKTLDMAENFIASFLKKINRSKKTFIFVSNEVGLGVVPPYPLGRIFRDIMGSVNKMIARQAGEVDFFVAGIRQKVK